MSTIKINEKEYKVKYTIRALFLFEQITEKPFKLETLLDNYLFYYCMILANNKDNVLEWDTFINAIDDNPELLNELSEILAQQQQKDKLFNSSNEGEQKKS